MEQVGQSGEEDIGDARLSRRVFMRGAGMSAIAVGVVGCRSDGDDDGEFSEEVTPASSATGEVTAAPDATPAPSPSPGGTYLDLLDAPETWTQPAVWTPRGEDQLVLRVVEDQHQLLFSYHGTTPGPTVRMKGDETLFLRLENGLSGDQGKTTIGYSPFGLGGKGVYPGPEGTYINTLFKQDQLSVFGGSPDAPIVNKVPTEPKEDWCLGEHVNGVHSAHVTNLHGHGLHVRPAKNSNGTHSDNIYLRIVPAEDWARIEENPECVERLQEALSLKEGEIIDSVADFEFQLGRTEAVPVHPPGTHWYHPHSHGSTHNQVASGMAGFLLVVGDVDEAINRYFTGDPDADPDRRAGDWDYRERAVFIQRVFNNPSTDPDRDRCNLVPKQGGTSVTARTNGGLEPNVMVMRPGAVERWRVLNGSVDGSGFIRVMVLKGRFEVTSDKVFVRVADDGTGSADPTFETEYAGTITVGETPMPLLDLKQPLLQLSQDGVTLVQGEGAAAEYYIKDLDGINDGKDPDFASLAECYVGDNPKRCYSRPREIFLSDANRADLFFQAPQLDDPNTPEVYTIVGMPTDLHDSPGPTTGLPTIIGHVVVRGEPVTAAFEPNKITLPPVPPYLVPIPDEELELSPAERQALGDPAGSYRTRTVRYAGWGSASYPRTDVPASEVDANPDSNKLAYYQPDPEGLLVAGSGGEPVEVTNLARFGDGELPVLLLPPNTRTMSIDGHKFEPTSQETPVMWLDTAEEWAVFNESMECYSINTNDVQKEGFDASVASANALEQLWYTYDAGGDPVGPEPWGNPTAYPLRPAQLAAANQGRGGDGQPALINKLSTAGADHPFHIHQNPFWLTRLDVPNEDGDLINVLDAPLWSDVTFLPRNGGRAVLRSRFVDYVGEYVNHCHILLHEDNGMMQRVQIVPSPTDPDFDPDARPADYVPSDLVTGFDATPDQANAAHPPPTPGEMYLSCASFIDDNNSGQVYPLASGWLPPVPDPAQRPT